MKNNLYFHIRSLFHQERKRAEGKISENELEIKINEFIENWIEYQEIKDRYDSILKFRTYFLVLFLLSAGLFITYLINPAFSIGIYDTITMGSVSFGLGFAAMIWFIFRVSDLQNSMSKYELSKKSFEELRPDIKNKFSKFIN